MRWQKYHAKRTTVDGFTFDSKAEAEYYQTLLILKRGGEVKKIELQPAYELQPPYKRNGKKIRPIIYRADFKVLYRDGHEEVVDVKGAVTREYKLKKKILLYRYPELNFVEVKV